MLVADCVREACARTYVRGCGLPWSSKIGRVCGGSSVGAFEECLLD